MLANKSDGERYYEHPPFFLFAMKSQLKLSKIFELINSEVEKNYSPGSSIDAIFVLGKGLIIDLGNGKESFRILNPKTGEAYTKWYQQHSDNVLFDFLAWLSIVMPRLVGGSSIIIPYMMNMLFPSK